MANYFKFQSFRGQKKTFPPHWIIKQSNYVIMTVETLALRTTTLCSLSLNQNNSMLNPLYSKLYCLQLCINCTQMHSTSADCESFLSKKLNNEPEKLGSSLAWIVTETWVLGTFGHRACCGIRNQCFGYQWKISGRSVTLILSSVLFRITAAGRTGPDS